MRIPEVIDRRTVYAGEFISVRADRDAAGSTISSSVAMAT
jgi:hypothetical protein